MWHNSKTQNVTKLKNPNIIKIKKSKYDKNQNLKNVTQLKNSKFDKTQKLKILQNSTTQTKQN